MPRGVCRLYLLAKFEKNPCETSGRKARSQQATLAFTLGNNFFIW